MEQVKRWQIVVFVAAVAAMAFGVWWSLGRGPTAKSSHETLLVDVTTGDLFDFSTKNKGVVIPERNPDTGKIALFPVQKTEGGEWVVESRYLGKTALKEVEGDPKMLDAGTGKVKVSSETPKRYVAKRH
ncbi:MAG: hypothetical protein IPJ41_12430 [Phycisphaerales bacterium]|nr:hypothetical protein [Phycisphaerales bacterium]